MIYQYYCEKCEEVFTRDLKLDDRNTPLALPCPHCNATNTVKRDFSTVSLTYDTMDVQTRARKVAGEGFTEVMKRIHKGAGKHSKMQI